MLNEVYPPGLLDDINKRIIACGLNTITFAAIIHDILEKPIWNVSPDQAEQIINVLDALVDLRYTQ